MFVRKIIIQSGLVSLQIIAKSKECYHVNNTIGSSSSISEFESLYIQGKRRISSNMGEQDISLARYKALEERQVSESLFSNIENILLNSIQLVLNKVFKLIGFDVIKDIIFWYLAIAWLSQPMRKSATVGYLKLHFNDDVQLYCIYRYFGKFYNI